MALSASIADGLPSDALAAPRPFDVLSSKLWTVFVLMFLGLSLVSVAELIQSPISCKLHRGAFDSGFSADFDIDHLDCRISWMKDSPSIRFWRVYPFVALVK